MYLFHPFIGQCIFLSNDCFQSFAAPDVTFACRPEFSDEFSKNDVREGVVVDFIKFVLHHAQVSETDRVT